MKKIAFTFLSILFLFIIVGCGTSEEKGDIAENNVAVELTESQSLGLSTYLASSFLSDNDATQDMRFKRPSVRLLTSTTTEENSEDIFKIDTEIEEVNIYFSKLKVFMDKGLDQAINIQESDSTREGYDFQVTYSIDEISYTIFYSYLNNEVEEEDDDEQEFKLRGLMIIDDVEYELEGANEIEEDESKLWFKTIDTMQTGNYVNVEIKEEDGEQKFEIETAIDGIEKKSEIKFEEDDDETKIELKMESEDQESSYEFKKETEDGKSIYKFEYEINEIEGEVKIYEYIDEQGNLSYKYKIEEDGKRKEVEHQDSNRNDDEEDDDDDDDEEDDD